MLFLREGNMRGGNLREGNLRKRKRWKSETAGFTLIELMISLSIIVIVMAIAIPNFQSASEKAQRAGCASNQKIILGHIENYYLENKQYPLTTFTALKDMYKSEGGTEGGSTERELHMDIDEKIVGSEVEGEAENAYFHRAYHALKDEGDAGNWLPLDIQKLKEGGYFREMVRCPRGGIYAVKIDEKGRVADIMCTVQGSLVE